MLDIIASYHRIQFQEKLMAENLVLGLILPIFDQNFCSKKIFVGFISTRCFSLLQAIIVCTFKEN